MNLRSNIVIKLRIYLWVETVLPTRSRDARGYGKRSMWFGSLDLHGKVIDDIFRYRTVFREDLQAIETLISYWTLSS
jgi:hypothetical protein